MSVQMLGGKDQMSVDKDPPRPEDLVHFHSEDVIGVEVERHGLVLRVYASSSERPLHASDKWMISNLADEMLKKLLLETTILNPKNQAWTVQWLHRVRLCFEDAGFTAVYLDQVPNEYCDCCPHRPWVVVTTTLGRIKVGWRKSVIVLDWSASDLKVDVESLFASEDVTKSGRLIHAHGYEKLTEYLKRLRATVHPVQP